MSRGPAGFTLLALLVVLAALTLVVGMALQRGEDERRSAILVRHEALALSAAEFGLDRSRAYIGAILDKEGDLDKALDPLLNTNCVSLPHFDSDAGTADDNLPVIAGGAREYFGGKDRPFLLLPYNADGDDAGTAEAAYLIRIEDNDDDGPGPELTSTTGNNVKGPLGCQEGLKLLATAAAVRSNPIRDRDRTVVVTVVGIAPGKDVTRAQARKVLRARLGSPPAAGLITGGSIDLHGASHVCGPYGNVSVSNGSFDNGCVCGSKCGKGHADQSCGSGNVCNVQTSSTDNCNVDFGGAGGNCTTGATVPPPPKVEVWSKLNAPPACTAEPCTPFYYLRADNFTGVGLPTGKGTDNAQVFMWDYAACPDPQSFDRIHYPGEAGSIDPLEKWNLVRAALPTGGCWRLVYDGNSTTCPDKEVKMMDEPSLTKFTPFMQTACGSSSFSAAPVIWKVDSSTEATLGVGTCDNDSTVYPGVGAKRYLRNYVTGGTLFYEPDTSKSAPPAPIPRGVWLVDGNLTFKGSTPGFTVQQPVTIMATGNVIVGNNIDLALRPAHREVALLVGRDLDINGGGKTQLLTCGDPSSLPATCPSAAIMVHEQFTIGANSHLQGQLVVQSAGSCSTKVSGKAVQTTGNSTISVPAMPPIVSPGGAAVLSWGEGSL